MISSLKEDITAIRCVRDRLQIASDFRQIGGNLELFSKQGNTAIGLSIGAYVFIRMSERLRTIQPMLDATGRVQDFNRLTAITAVLTYPTKLAS